MRTVRNSIALTLLLCSPAPAETSAGPPTVYWESAQLAATKQRVQGADPELRAALAKLRSNADRALDHGPYSVMQKKELPPSGDKHDYLSYSRYWWPNPESADGLPYVRHDGKTNVEIRSKGDRDRIGQLFDDVESLALAYYFFAAEKYAAHASLLIRTWLLSSETKMNPHLRYGQGVPGRSEGRGVGILDTRGFITLLDAVALLSDSPSLTAADQQGLRQWFAEYLDWLRTSDLGREESQARNNHGSWYAAQVARIALFVGAEEVARDIVHRVQTIRIPSQFQADGSQPFESQRTRSLHYSCFNLSALAVVARVGEQLGIDLWRAPSGAQGSMQQGLNYLRPYLADQDKWPHQQIDEYELAPRIIQLFRMASVRYGNADYAKVINQIDHLHAERNYAPLVCAALPVRQEGNQAAVVTILEEAEPTLSTYELPDLSDYSIENIRKRVTASRPGLATVGPTARETFLKEIFRKQRGVDLQSRQAVTETRAIKIERGTLTLRQLVRQLDDESIAAAEEIEAPNRANPQVRSIVTLRLPVLIQPGATLLVDGRETAELRLSTDRGALIANAGTLFILDSRVSSWNETAGRPTPFRKAAEFRPFIASYVRSHTFLAGSTFEDLGYLAPTAYGLSLTSHPEREQGEVSHDWPTGEIVGNVFRGLFYGFYSYEARDVAIVNNLYDGCIRYGIDPHDRSTRLIIANNTAQATRERHGIIGSRGITASFIFDNRSFANQGSGIMLDRQCAGNVVAGNQVYNNGQGIAIYESSANIIANNTVCLNAKSGLRIRNSTDIAAQENIVVGNGGYGFEVESKRLDDDQERVARGDRYVRRVEVSIDGNTVTGNREGCIQGSRVQSLRLGNLRTNLKPAEVRAILRQAGIPAEVAVDVPLDVAADQTFGSELKPFSTRLQRVFDADRPVVHFRAEGQRALGTSEQ